MVPTHSLFRCEIDATPYLLALTKNEILMLSGSKKELDQKSARLESGEDIAEDFDNEDIGHLEYKRIRRVSGFVNSSVLQVKKLKTEMTLTFAAQEEAARFCDALQHLSGAVRSDYLSNAFAAAVIPALWVIAGLVLTAGLIAAGLVHDPQAQGPGLEGRQRGIVIVIYAVASTLGPIGGGILGLLITALPARACVHRFRNPPTAFELTKFSPLLKS